MSAPLYTEQDLSEMSKEELLDAFFELRSEQADVPADERADYQEQIVLVQSLMDTK